MKALSSYYLSIGIGFLFFVISGSYVPTSYASGDVYVHGTLIAEPCTLMPGDEEIEVDFDTIVDKYLYINTRTHPEPFSIHLIDCEVGIGEGVRVGFIGTEHATLPGLLALDADSVATRVGVGILDSAGKLIPINSETPLYLLENGSNTLNFQGYVEAELDAIKNKTIGLGTFKATAVFILNYE
ncbi:fimbrial protein [Providencia stuartii]|uniref:fimbrial protein n=1 Tax=Providencia stuartii TaxID=588 RepID=UPI00300C7ACA